MPSQCAHQLLMRSVLSHPLRELRPEEARRLDVMLEGFPCAIAEVLFRDTADGPLVGRGRLLAGDLSGLAVPEDAVGAGPAVAGVHVAAVVNIQCTVSADAVVEDAVRPALVGSDVGMGLLGCAVEEQASAVLDGEASPWSRAGRRSKSSRVK